MSKKANTGKSKPTGNARPAIKADPSARPGRVELRPLDDPPTPREIDGLFCVFPARVIGTLLPEHEKIPAEFFGISPWVEFVNHWFFRGLPSDVQFHAKSGVKAMVALQHVNACMRSFEPKHEHKVAGCAYLCACFFEKVVFPSEKKEFGNP